MRRILGAAPKARHGQFQMRTVFDKPLTWSPPGRCGTCASVREAAHRGSRLREAFNFISVRSALSF